MDSDHSEVKVDKYYLKKIILCIVWEDQFMYILLGIDYKYNVNGYSPFFLSFLDPFLLGPPF